MPLDPGDLAKDQSSGAEWTLDPVATYRLGRWDFTVGGDNVFNSCPDEMRLTYSTNGQLPYSTSSPFGFNGAFAYGRIG